MTKFLSNGTLVTNDREQIKFDLAINVQVWKVLVRTGQFVFKDEVIFTMIDSQGQRHSFRSPITGHVIKLFIHESDILSHNSNILEYRECRHSIIINSLCSMCGVHTKELGHLSSRLNALKTSLGFSLPEVTITREAALKFHAEDDNYLLRNRKLHLLVDLDQTLVHTTNTDHQSPYAPDVFTYQLNSCTPQTFYIKLRPGVKTFLANLRSLFQFHIVTFGDRLYARTVAKLIDPDGMLFSDRIIAREDSLSSTDKSTNLTNLFPCGQSLVCIIDDHDDVWRYASNVVRVKPYTWFEGVNDINGTHLPPLPITTTRKRQFNGQDEFNDSKEQNVVDNDRYLSRLEVILKGIHSTFYDTYDRCVQNKQRTSPDLNQIMPEMRRHILSSVSLCFSHLMPESYPLEEHRATIIAQAMGAKVSHDFQFDSNGTIQTTHVIAGKYTMKVHRALQYQVKIVTPEWLIDCYEEWHKQAEENYPLTSNYDVTKSRLFTDEIPRISKRNHRDMEEHVSTVTQSFSSMNANENDAQSCRFKRQCIASTVDSKQEDMRDEQIEDCESDSSSICNVKDLDLDSSGEDDLDGDQVPRGWIKAYEQIR